MNGIPTGVACYIFVVTALLIVMIYAWAKQRELLRKNKFKYDLRQIRHELEPLGNDAWRLNFYCGHILHSEVVTEADLFNDKNYFYKAFVSWCEEDADEKQG